MLHSVGCQRLMTYWCVTGWVAA